MRDPEARTKVLETRVDRIDPLELAPGARPLALLLKLTCVLMPQNEKPRFYGIGSAPVLRIFP